MIVRLIGLACGLAVVRTLSRILTLFTELESEVFEFFQKIGQERK